MTQLDELRPATYSVDSQQALFRLLAKLFAILSIALLSSNSFAQRFFSQSTNDLVPSIELAPREIPNLDFDFGTYGQSQIESLEDLGRLSQSAGEHQQALVLFKHVLRVARINQGLHYES